MTFYDLIKHTMNDVDEDLLDHYMKEKIKMYINRGYKELAKRECLEKSILAYPNDLKIRKPSDCFKVVGVLYEGASVNNNIEGKYVVLDTDYEEVTLIYNYIPADLEQEDDETETNEANVEFIIAFAKHLYYQTEGLLDEAAMLRADLQQVRLILQQSKFTKIVDVYGGGYNS